MEGDGFGFFVDPTTLPAAQAVQQPAATKAAAASSEQKSAKADKTDRGEKAEKGQAGLESSTLRVSVEKVDQLINLVGELVITQAMLTQQAKQFDPVQHQSLMSGISDLERNTRHLQESVMSIRMIPMSFVFNRFPRMIRDLAAKLGKDLELKMVGEATELDKGLIEKITDPLTHLVRNSADHGVESPAKRVAAGKSATGTITLAASHQGGSILIEVKDDGAGLNRDRILRKARERGLAVRDEMTDMEVWALIWEPGFSTADTLSDVSGRGVGMDVVRRNITALGGTVELDSAEGYGTRVSIRLPLTLAIMDGMSISVGDETYILPLASVVESFQVKPGMIQTVGSSGRVVKVREEYLPVVALEEVYRVPRFDDVRASEIMVIIEAEGRRVAALVDELLGQQQVVVKNLEANYKRVPNVSGATILGDGRVALIIDVSGLVKRARH
jgi:two-component system chemotaxis sensor kinase CheA